MIYESFQNLSIMFINAVKKSDLSSSIQSSMTIKDNLKGTFDFFQMFAYVFINIIWEINQTLFYETESLLLSFDFELSNLSVFLICL